MDIRLVTGVIGILAGAGVMLGMHDALASAPGAEVRGGPGITTHTFLLKNSMVRTIDLAPAGPSQGDQRVITGPLFAPGGTRQLGRTNLFCTITDPAGEAPSSLQETVCIETFTLPGGMITAEGLHARTTILAHARPFDDAVTGGTGAYLGVRGDLQGTTRGNVTTFTARLLVR